MVVPHVAAENHHRFIWKWVEILYKECAIGIKVLIYKIIKMAMSQHHLASTLKILTANTNVPCRVVLPTFIQIGDGPILSTACGTILMPGNYLYKKECTFLFLLFPDIWLERFREKQTRKTDKKDRRNSFAWWKLSQGYGHLSLR